MEMKPDFKMTEVGMIPGDWEVKPLGALISSLEAGVSVNSVAKEKDVYAHNESILKTSCAIGGTFLPEEHKTIIPRDIHRARLNPCKDSIVISRMNTPALVVSVVTLIKRYLWRDILKLRREQCKAAQQAQPVLFNLQDDERPKSQRTAAARYEEPALF